MSSMVRGTSKVLPFLVMVRLPLIDGAAGTGTGAATAAAAFGGTAAVNVVAIATVVAWFDAMAFVGAIGIVVFAEVVLFEITLLLLFLVLLLVDKILVSKPSTFAAENIDAALVRFFSSFLVLLLVGSFFRLPSSTSNVEIRC